ncbi:MAG: hypothetical protein GC168_00395 [Candidatus Hydrogenedens sp.]|nr:hypothetical protein [Candidatus Hydrogenedens sp.]
MTFSKWITIGVAGLLVGCGSAVDTASNEAAEALIEHAAKQDGVDADVEISNGGSEVSMNLTTERGAETIQTGANVAMPEGFPKDIPVPDGVTLNMVNTAANTKTFNIQAATSQTIEAIVAYYKKEAPAQGWTETTSTAMAGVMASLEYEKDDRVLRVIATGGDGNTMLTLNTELK